MVTSSATALFCFSIALCSAVCSSTCIAEDATKRYKEGTLKRVDFRASVPAGDRMDAVVFTQLGYRFHYRVMVVGGKLRLVCDAIECYAEQVPDKSWLKDFEDRSYRQILDHEQGHFDLAEIASRKAAVRLRHLMRMKKLRADGATIPLAQKALVRLIESQMAPFDRKLILTNLEYDEQTGHGIQADAQKKARLDQQKQLRALAK